ncbi:Cysteine protease atg4 [Malassezia sp. CBS 17886]|nr:Cysteine protease atg4 [Malassezia sp. CBS 17886]
MYSYALPRVSALSLTDCVHGEGLHAEIAQATQQRANVEQVLRDTTARENALRVVQAVSEYLPHLLGVYNSALTDTLLEKREFVCTWRSPLTAGSVVPGTGAETRLRGIISEVCAMHCVYALALHNQAAATVDVLGAYELDTRLSVAERGARDDRLKVATDILRRESGVWEFLAARLLPLRDAAADGGSTPPEMDVDVARALAQLALADAHRLALRKLLSPSLAAASDTLTPGPPLAPAHPSPALVAKLELHTSSLYKDALTLFRTYGERPAEHRAPPPVATPGLAHDAPRPVRRLRTTLQGLRPRVRRTRCAALAEGVVTYAEQAANWHCGLAYKWLGIDAGESSKDTGWAIACLRHAHAVVARDAPAAKGGALPLRGRLWEQWRAARSSGRDGQWWCATEQASILRWLRAYERLNDSVDFQRVPPATEVHLYTPEGRAAVSAHAYDPPVPSFGPRTADDVLDASQSAYPGLSAPRPMAAAGTEIGSDELAMSMDASASARGQHTRSRTLSSHQRELRGSAAALSARLARRREANEAAPSGAGSEPLGAGAAESSGDTCSESAVTSGDASPAATSMVEEGDIASPEGAFPRRIVQWIARVSTSAVSPDALEGDEGAISPTSPARTTPAYPAPAGRGGSNAPLVRRLRHQRISRSVTGTNASDASSSARTRLSERLPTRTPSRLWHMTSDRVLRPWSGVLPNVGDSGAWLMGVYYGPPPSQRHTSADSAGSAGGSIASASIDSVLSAADSVSESSALRRRRDWRLRLEAHAASLVWCTYRNQFPPITADGSISADEEAVAAAVSAATEELCCPPKGGKGGKPPSAAGDACAACDPPVAAQRGAAPPRGSEDLPTPAVAPEGHSLRPGTNGADARSASPVGAAAPPDGPAPPRDDPATPPADALSVPETLMRVLHQSSDILSSTAATRVWLMKQLESRGWELPGLLAQLPVVAGAQSRQEPTTPAAVASSLQGVLDRVERDILRPLRRPLAMQWRAALLSRLGTRRGVPGLWDYVGALYHAVSTITQPVGLTTDAGWGCMLRTTQCMLANALIRVHLGRDWRLPLRAGDDATRWESKAQHAQYARIVSWFLDDPSSECPFSIHRLAAEGKHLGMHVGEWFGPSTAAAALRHLVDQYAACGIGVVVSNDGMVYRSDVCRAAGEGGREDRDAPGDDPTASSGGADVRRAAGQAPAGDIPAPPLDVFGSSPAAVLPPPAAHPGRPAAPQHARAGRWRPVLILAAQRLGIDAVAPPHRAALLNTFAFPQTVGIAGGRPASSLYFVGRYRDNVLFLDPHTTRTSVPFRHPPPSLYREDRAEHASGSSLFTSWYCNAYAPQELATFQASQVHSMPVGSMDPSMLFGFLCTSEADWDDLQQRLQALDAPLLGVADAPQERDADVDSEWSDEGDRGESGDGVGGKGGVKDAEEGVKTAPEKKSAPVANTAPDANTAPAASAAPETGGS